VAHFLRHGVLINAVCVECYNCLKLHKYRLGAYISTMRTGEVIPTLVMQGYKQQVFQETDVVWSCLQNKCLTAQQYSDAGHYSFKIQGSISVTVTKL